MFLFIELTEYNKTSYSGYTRVIQHNKQVLTAVLSLSKKIPSTVPAITKQLRYLQLYSII